MNSITVFIFRIMLILGGCILIYIIGKPVLETIQYRLSGQNAEGRVIGFRGRGSSITVFEENTSKHGKKARSRRPVYRFPVSVGSLDSLDAFSKSSILLPWLNFELNEKVSIVFKENEPDKSYIFSLGSLISDMVLLLLSGYMIKLGVTRFR